MARGGPGSFNADLNFASRHYIEQIDCDVQNTALIAAARYFAARYFGSSNYLSTALRLRCHRSSLHLIVLHEYPSAGKVTVVREVGRSPFS